MRTPINWDTPGQPYFKQDPKSGEFYCTKCGFERQAGHGNTCPAHPLNKKPLAVGSVVWMCDRWSRDGLKEYIVVGETKVSWCILPHTEYNTPERFDKDTFQGFKLPKRECDRTYILVKVWNGSERVWLDFEAMYDEHWVDANRWRITKAVETLTTAKLREVAKLIDYREEVVE